MTSWWDWADRLLRWDHSRFVFSNEITVSVQCVVVNNVTKNVSVHLVWDFYHNMSFARRSSVWLQVEYIQSARQVHIMRQNCSKISLFLYLQLLPIHHDDTHKVCLFPSKILLTWQTLGAIFYIAGGASDDYAKVSLYQSSTDLQLYEIYVTEFACKCFPF